MKNENAPEIEQELHERLCAYVFGELQGEERAAFERELLQSSELRAERARMEATIGLVKRAIPDEGLSLAVRRDVLASAKRSRFRFLSGRRLLSLAAAGVLLLGGALGVRWLAGGDDGEPFGYSRFDQKVARQAAPESIRTMKVVTESRAKREDAPEAFDALRGLGYVGGDSAPKPSAAPAEESTALLTFQESELLDALGYGGSASEGNSGMAAAEVMAVAKEAAPSGASLPASEAQLSALQQPQSGTGKGASYGTGTASAYAARRAGSAGRPMSVKIPVEPAASGTDAFFLGQRAEDEGAYRGPGDSLPPGGDGAQLTKREDAGEKASTESLRAMGYVGDDEDEGESDRRENWARDLGQPASQGERAPKPVLTREQVTVEVGRLLEATRPAPGESPRDMFFRYWGDAPFVLAREEHTSTFAVDVDTASYALARSYLNNGQLPPRAAVRTEEFVNYFKADQAPPSDGKPFAIGLELAPSLFATDTRAELLRVTVRAKDVADFERQPVALTFVIDNSGSMKEGGRLELVKRSLALLLRQLYAGDTVAIVKFSNSAAVVTEPLPVARRGELESLIQALPIEGGTNVEAGLRLGYDLAVQNLQRNTVNRVILCSDGVGNIGETSSTGLLALVKDARAKGIYLNTVGVGMGNHNDAFLEQLANQGDGVCNYVDSDAEAKRVFVDGLASALQPIARDVKIQVELDPAQVESWRLLGYENRALLNRHFRDDAIDAGEVNAGHQVSALYELVRQPGQSGPLATVRVRYKPPFAIDQGKEGTAARKEAEVALELERTIASVEARPGFAGTSSGYQRAVLVAQFAEVLRNSVHARSDSLATLVQESRRLAGVLDDPDFAEFVALLAKANPLLDARSKQAPPKVQGLLDELALAQFELARGERMRQLETDAASSAEELERRLGALSSGLAGRDVEGQKAREDELRARIQRLEAEVGAELGQVYGLAPATREELNNLGYGSDDTDDE